MMWVVKTKTNEGILMAIRNIRIDGDEILRKRSKEVEIIDERILILIKDMAETMYEFKGVGLAAPQVGALKRIIVIDIGDGIKEYINPIIVKKTGEQCEAEGCLSVPGITGEVKRPAKVVVKALNMKGKEFKTEGTELMATALCHEIDHLDGILFIDKATNITDTNNEEENSAKEQQR